MAGVAWQASCQATGSSIRLIRHGDDSAGKM